MPDQFNALESLLDPDDAYADPVKRAATAATLRRQNALGVVGQLMNLEPTKAAGSFLQEQAQTSLKSALEKQRAQKEAAARASERQQAQSNWEAQMERDRARDEEQRRQFGVQEARLGRAAAEEGKKQWQVAIDPITGEMRLYNQYTGEWKDNDGSADAGGAAAPGTADAPRTPGFAPPPKGTYGKQTEGEQKSQFYATTMTMALPEMTNALSGGYMPSRIDQFAAGPQSSGIGGRIQANTPRGFSSEEGRRFYTAGRQVLAGILRKESGAAITDDEWQNYGPMYLPWPGDSPAEIDRKMQVLHAQAENAARGSGAAYRYWTAPTYLPIYGGDGPGAERAGSAGMPAPQAAPGPRAGDKYLGG